MRRDELYLRDITESADAIARFTKDVAQAREILSPKPHRVHARLHGRSDEHFVGGRAMLFELCARCEVCREQFRELST